jgi:hypothetical protein
MRWIRDHTASRRARRGRRLQVTATLVTVAVTVEVVPSASLVLTRSPGFVM